MTQMTPRERELRRGLDHAVCRLGQLLSRCQVLEDMPDEVALDAAQLIAEANGMLETAASYVDGLRRLEQASDEAIALAAASNMALFVAREALTLMTARLDARDVAV